MRIDITRQQISACLLELRGMLDDDEQLKLDMLEGETDLFEIAVRLLDDMEADEGIILALKEQIDNRQTRKKAAEARIAARREALQGLMDCAGIDKLPLPEATVSMRKVPPKLVVTDAEKIPDDYCQFIRKPDMVAIKAANDPVEGTAMDNGGVSISIRRK